MKKVFVDRSGSNRGNLISQIITGIALVMILILQSAAQTPRKTDRSADQSLRSSARVNPSTLAMEFSIPITGYPGRAGNGMPLALNYSSKVWQIDNGLAWIDVLSPRTDNFPRFARHSAAGWTTTLGSPRIDQKQDVYCESGDNGSGQPWSPPPVGGDDPQPCQRQYVARLRVEMPDGSAHEFRQDDGYHAYGASDPQLTGTLLSTDGSRMRLEMSRNAEDAVSARR